MPLLANGIALDALFVGGLVVLTPVMLFLVLVEGLILRKIWSQPYGTVCRVAFKANLSSLLAGVPTKLLNALLYSLILPADVPGYLARYPFAIALGTLIYFGVTLAVELNYAFDWVRREDLPISRTRIWRGILIANLTTYAILAPIHYVLTRPNPDLSAITSHTRWAANPDQRILFLDSDGSLNSIRLDGSQRQTVVPRAMKSYLISADLSVCVYLDGEGKLFVHRGNETASTLVTQTSYGFSMKAVAFSPRGQYVAFVLDNRTVEVFNVATGNRTHIPFEKNFSSEEPSIAWSTTEDRFYVDPPAEPLISFQIHSDDHVVATPVSGTDDISILKCYSQSAGLATTDGVHHQLSTRNDRCGNIKVFTFRGLTSSVAISAESESLLALSINTGVLRMSAIQWDAVSFLPGCEEVVLESDEHLYLLNHRTRHLGTITRGTQFVLFTPRFEKRL